MSENFVKGKVYKDNKDNKDTTRINNAIKSREVRVIDDNGEMLGIFSLYDALAKAADLGLDLVEVNPESKPPVCKIMDYGKHKYQIQKKKQEGKKKQKTTILKELYIHLGIAEHDYQVKFRALKAFLEDGCKVKIAVKLRGREMAYSQKGIELLNRFYEDIGKESVVKLDTPPKLEGNNVITIFSPVSTKPNEQ